MAKQFYVYILASGKHGTLYIGVTSNLIQRVYQHKQNQVEGFSERYSVHSLVFYEVHEDALSALNREKRLKFWKRQWKIELIEQQNPQWRDLYPDILG